MESATSSESDDYNDLIHRLELLAERFDRINYQLTMLEKGIATDDWIVMQYLNQAKQHYKESVSLPPEFYSKCFTHCSGIERNAIYIEGQLKKILSITV